MSQKPFKTLASLLPRKATPVRAVYDVALESIEVTFTIDVNVGGPAAPGWSAVADGAIRNPNTQANISSKTILLTTAEGAPSGANPSVSYDNGLGDLSDDFGRNVPSFVDFPLTIPVEVVSATFSQSTGDIVVGFSEDINLRDDDKKPWTSKVDLIKQNVQTVTQSASDEITLTTSSDGPDSPGDSVSYDSASGCVEDMNGARTAAIIEFPLTLIA